MNVLKLDRETAKELDAQMQKGYEHFMHGIETEACEAWLDLWEKIKATMKRYRYHFIDDLDKDFQGKQYISNWAMDFDEALSNAAEDDQKFYRSRIQFCTDYIEKSRNKEDEGAQVFMRDIAESWFRIGEAEKGEQLFQDYAKKFPTSGWGWINWSDQYWLFAEDEHKDANKAVNLLKQGLEKMNTEDKVDALERLRDIYTDLNADDQVTEVEKQIQQAKAEQKKTENQDARMYSAVAATRAQVKR